MHTHGLEPQRHSLRITVFAALRDLGTTNGWVPGPFGPLNLALCAHGLSEFEFFISHHDSIGSAP